MKAKIGHINSINSLRGLAALSVVFYHFICTTTDYITNQTVLDIFHFGNKGVQVFFIISGIVIPLSMIKAKYSLPLFGKFILKRFTRIEPPYIGVVLIGILYLYARNFVPSSAQVDLTPSIRDVALHFGYLVPFVEDAKWIKPVFWTLSVEFQYYLFLAIIFPLALQPKLYKRTIFYACILLFPILIPTGVEFLPYWSPFFGLGIFYILYRTSKINNLEYVFITFLTSILVVKNQGYLDLGIGIFTLIIIHNFSNFKSKIGSFLGDISYSVYLLHSVVGSAYVNFMSHRFNEPLGQFFVILSGILITILSAYIYWKLIEKPSQRLAQKIKLKRQKNN